MKKKILVVKGNGDDSIRPCASGDHKNPDALPEAIRNYLATQHLGMVVPKVEVCPFEQGGFYEVELANGKELYFNAKGGVPTGSGRFNGSSNGNNTYDDYKNAKEKALGSIRNNYPDEVDDSDEIQPELEFGKRFVKVEFNDDLELRFNPDPKQGYMDDDHGGSGITDDDDGSKG